MEEGDRREYAVLVICEAQYSLWVDHREIPIGWRVLVARHKKQACQAYVTEVWTGIRRLGLRQAIPEVNARQQEEPPPAALSAAPSADCSDTGSAASG